MKEEEKKRKEKKEKERKKTRIKEKKEGECKERRIKAGWWGGVRKLARARIRERKVVESGIALKFTSHGFVVARCYQTTDCLENRCPWNVISSPTALFGSQIDKRHADSWGRATFRET